MAKTKVIERKPLTFAEKTFLPQIVSGLKTTFGNIFKPAITLEYPEERPPIPEGYRGVPTLVKDPNGREKCVSCQLCEFVCPPKAIRITPGEIPEEIRRGLVDQRPFSPLLVVALNSGSPQTPGREIRLGFWSSIPPGRRALHVHGSAADDMKT